MFTFKQNRVEAALALLRVIVGVVFLTHGVQKLFTYGISGVSGAFAQQGLPTFLAPIVSLGEFLGGIALIVGFLTPVAALGLSVIMLGAIVKVHLPNGFYNPTGFEYPLTLLATLVTFALTGAGSYSLDGVLARRRSS